MSTTIDSLDIQIGVSAGQAASKIGQLATELGRLKENGKITSATNGLKKLAGALDTLNPALNGLNPAKLQQVRAAMQGFANIQKLSGLSSAIKTLQKIPTVMTELDAVDMTKLEAQMIRLSRAIAPLAKEMDKLGTSFAKLPSHLSKVVTLTNKSASASKKAAAATRDHGSSINSTSLNIMSAIQNFESVIHVMQIVGNTISATMSQAMEWDGIQYRFGRAFGEDAEEVLAYAEKINDVLGINIQQFMQYSSLYGSLLSGFGMAQDKVTTISVGLTELSYDIWAAYNDRFKSLEDASEAVRSAITGEIEPIRNAGIALTEASLQEYLEQIGMANVSIEKLSESQKAEVRYAAMMNAAMNQGIVGTYASEMQTAEGAVRSLSQSFKGLIQAFGSLFIPILQAAIPYLTAFVNLLYEAVAAIASFFGFAFFEIDWGNGVSAEMSGAAAGAEKIESAMGGASGAAKKLKDYVMGFDELNIIQPPDEGGGGGGGGAGAGADWGNGLDLDTLWDESVFAKASQQVNELKQTIKDWFEEWKTEIAIVAAALGALSIASLLTSLGQAMGLGEGFLGVMGTIKKLASTAIVITLQYSLMSEFFGNFIEEGSWKDYILAMVVGAIGTGILYSMWGPAGIVVGLSVTAIASFKAVFENGGITDAESATVAFTGLAAAVGAIVLAFKKVAPVIAASNFGAFLALLKEGHGFMPTLAAAFPKIASAISGAAGAVGAFLGGISAPVWGVIAAAISGVIGLIVFLRNNWEKVTEVVRRFFDENIAPRLENIKESWDKICEALSPVISLFQELWNWLDPIIEKIGEFFANLDWSFIGKAFEAIGAVVFGAIAGPIAGAINMFVGMIENIMLVFSGVVDFISGIVDLIVAIFSGGDIYAAWDSIWAGVFDVVAGLWGLITQPLSDFVQGIIDFFVDLWDVLVGHSIVPDTIEAIAEWFAKLPSLIFGVVSDFTSGIVERFKELWESIKTWWKSKVAPKFTLSYWKGVFDKVVSGASAKLGEIKTKISEVWNEVKAWFASNVAPKLTLAHWKEKFQNIVSGIKNKWEEAKTWWNNNKPTLNTVHAVVASIKDKLSTAWTTAKNWWNNNKPSLDSVKATIASVKDSLSTAWTTARTWWNNSKSSLNAVGVTITSIKTSLQNAWNTAKSWLDQQSLKLNIKMPHVTIGWNYNIPAWQQTIAGFLFDKNAIPYIDVQWYAEGGFPGVGEMFVAREAGPELVGKIGNRNAVVNNDQIVEAVSRGVYEAMAAAMGSYAGGSDQAINIYLDGKQITAAVEKHQRQRGATLMTGGMAYGY